MNEPKFWVHFAALERVSEPLRSVRETVFVHEQKVPEELEWDGSDEDCVHVVARNAEGGVIGTARIAPDGKIGRMAVLRPWRGHGVGDAMLCALLNYARNTGGQQVHLNAQRDATDFYRRHGFVAAGEEFVEAGIIHQHMTLGLAQPPLISYAGPHAPVHGGGALGLTEGRLILEGQRAHRLALMDLVSQARRTIRVFADIPGPVALGHPAVVEALRGFATLSTRTRIEAIFRDPQRSARQGARFLELARQLPNSFELRAGAEEQRLRTDLVVLVDEVAYLHQPNAERPTGTLEYRGEGRIVPLSSLVEEAWHHATPHVDLRRLSL